MYLLLIILVLFLLFGGGYGYHAGLYNSSPYFAPGFGIVGLVVIVLVVLLFMGRL